MSLFARRWPALLVAAILIWLVGFPLLLTALEAVGLAGGSAAVGAGGFTLDAVRTFLDEPTEWQALWNTVWISLASVVFAALVGVPLAFVFQRTDFPGRRVLGALIALPVALPPLVGVIAFLYLYGESGFAARGIQRLFGLEQAPWRLGGAWAILLVHTYSMYVYFYLLTRAALARLDAVLIEAAESLGASRWRTLWRVTMPQLRPALLGASLLTFMTSLGSFSAPYIFGGGFRVMTTQIVASKVNGEWRLAMVEAVVLAVVALTALVVIRKLRGEEQVVTAHGVAPRRHQIVAPAVRRLFMVIGWSLGVLLLLPHLTLVIISFVPHGTWTTELLPPVLTLDNYRELFTDTGRLRPILNSLWMAAVATVAAVTLGLWAARQSLLSGKRLGALLEGLIALPWAVPGTVFALALATTFSVQQPWVGRFVWVGTAVLLPLAYVVRALPITGRAALAGLRQLDPALEEAAKSLGAGPIRTLFRIVLPRIRPALLAGVGLAAITALGDFVASIVLYTYDTRPISIEILSTLRDQFGVAAAYGVLLMILSAIVFLIWGRGEEAGV